MKKLYIEPASCCNLNCSMCFRHNWIDEKMGLMTSEIFAKIEELLFENPPEYIMFGGMGEPLTHPDILNMVKKCVNSGAYTELLTNGTMLDKDTAQGLADAGLNRLWISIDGFDRDAYEGIHKGSQFDLIIKNIECFNFVCGERETGLTFVMMKENVGELDKINAFADRFSFDVINLSHVIPSSSLVREDSIYDLQYVVGKQRRFGQGLQANKSYNQCPFIEEDACFVKWDGEVAPCMQLLHSSYTYLYEEKRKVIGKSFGNVLDNSIQSIWDGDEYIAFRQRVKDFHFPDCAICDGCDDRISNEKDCMFNEHPTCGACLWAQGIGRCP